MSKDLRIKSAMKVKDLIEELKKADPNKIVVISSDSEGNDFAPMDKDCNTQDYYYRDLELDESYGEPCVVFWSTK